MDYQLIGFIFACIGAAATVVWFVLLRSGIRSLRDVRDHLVKANGQSSESDESPQQE
jgi:hypothetical protein